MTTNENKDEITPAERIASGYSARSFDIAATGLTAAELDELKGLKQQANSETLTSTELLGLGYRISELERKYNANK